MDSKCIRQRKLPRISIINTESERVASYELMSPNNAKITRQPDDMIEMNNVASSKPEQMIDYLTIHITYPYSIGQ